MTETAARSLTILSESDNGHVLVDLNDNEKIMMSTSEAVNACRAIKDVPRFTYQFRDLIDRLRDWSEENAAGLSTTKINLRSDGILFVATQKHVPRDEELISKLTDLDIAIANDAAFDLITMNVLSLPRVEETSAFTSSGFTPPDNVFNA